MNIQKPCEIVIPDAGPLISLGMTNSLDLLLELNIPIIITDCVEFESSYYKKYEEASIIANFIDEHITVEKTEEGQIVKAFKEGAIKKYPKNTGENSIYSFLKEIHEKRNILGKELPIWLILFEDQCFIDEIKFSQIRFPNTHILSTPAFLKGLEEAQKLYSSERMIKDIESKRQRPFPDSILNIDRPATGIKSTWKPKAP